MRTMVIGSNSFLGVHLIRYLQTMDAQEIIAVSVNLPNDSVLPAEDTAIKETEADLSSIESVLAILNRQRPDRIFCILAVDSISYSWEHPAEVIQIHVNDMLNILGAVKEYNASLPIVAIGSGEEYGQVGFDCLPIKETQMPHPTNVYAATKTCQTMMSRLYCEAYQMRIMTARIFNAIGPFQPERFVVSDFCSQIAAIESGQTENKIYVGNLNIQRDFVDVRDVARALVLLCEKGRSGEVYNIGSGKLYSIRDVLNEVLAQTKVQVQIENQTDRLRPVDVPVLLSDCSKAEKETGWKPVYTLPDTVRDMLASAREKYNCL